MSKRKITNSLQSNVDERSVVSIGVKGEGLLTVGSTSSVSDVLVSETLRLESFVNLRPEFGPLNGLTSASLFLKKLKGLLSAYEWSFKDSAPTTSTPKKKEYVCPFSFKEQIELFRHLHPEVKTADECKMLTTGTKPWRRSCMRVVNTTDKVFFGGNFKESIAVSCVSRRCFEVVSTILDQRSRYAPETVNQSLFRAVSGHKEETRLLTLLTALSLNNMSVNDFNKELKEDKEKQKKYSREHEEETAIAELREENENLKAEVQSLRQKLEECTCDKAPYHFNDSFKSSGEPDQYNMPSPVAGPSRKRPRYAVNFNHIDAIEDFDDDVVDPDWEEKKSAESSSSDSSSCSIPKVDDKELLNQAIYVDKQPEKKMTGPLKKLRRVFQDKVDNQRTKRISRAIPQFVVGDRVSALWVNTKPHWENWYPAVIQSVLAAGETYMVRFSDDNVVKCLRKEAIKEQR